MADTLTVPAAATPTAAPEAAAKPIRAPKGPDKAGYHWGTGRRKTAVARVRIKPGAGKILINGRALDNYFNEIRDRNDILSPLKATKTEASLDVWANVDGGGITGQAGAVKLGVARALMGYDPSFEQALRDNDMLTRDSREVERKKYGQSGARRRFQFSKR
jgi:small subunit ribosomal protein S9